MATKVNSLPVWIQIRDALADDLSSTLEFLANAPFSADPASDFQQAKQQRDRIIDEMQQLAVLGIKEIDAEIASGELVQQIEGLAAKADQEANALKNAAKTIGKISSVVDTATSAVVQIGKLPFLS